MDAAIPGEVSGRLSHYKKEPFLSAECLAILKIIGEAVLHRLLT